MVVSVGHDYYFRPDGSQLLCSLSEEEPTEPGDPRPRMEDVALAIDRINEATDLEIRTVNSQWTGLRTFSPDRDLVIGEDPTAPSFYWLVGQGGTGIMTAPAYGELLASQVLGTGLPPTLAAAGVDPEVTSPARFRTG
jgi:D-arginine dehydrogenase